MARMTICNLFGARISIELALEMKGAGRADTPGPDFRCTECDQPVRPHRASPQMAAHFEHLRRNPDCSQSDPLRPEPAAGGYESVAVAEPPPIQYGQGAKAMTEQQLTLARWLAGQHAEMEPNITEIYLFPAEDELRLIEVDPSAGPPAVAIAPFHFPADGEVPIKSAIALITPEDRERLAPPLQWGSWDDGILIWSRAHAA